MKKIIILILVKLIILTFMMVIQPIGICENYNGEIFYVGGIGQGNFLYLQDAINISSNGDTILIYNGFYHENIIINKSINLIGENRNNTVIDGKENFEIIKINSSYVNITNIKIQNGSICGILIEDSFTIELAYTHGWWSDYGDNYGVNVSRTFQDIQVDNLFLNLTSRF